MTLIHIKRCICPNAIPDYSHPQVSGLLSDSSRSQGRGTLEVVDGGADGTGRAFKMSGITSENFRGAKQNIRSECVADAVVGQWFEVKVGFSVSKFRNLLCPKSFAQPYGALNEREGFYQKLC